jgi:hypothetical protein
MLEHSVIGIYRTLGEAEAAVHSLRDAGVPVARELGDHRLHGFAAACDVAKPAAAAGLWLGAIFGTFVGAAFFWVPAFGPLVVAGSLASAMIGGFEGAIAAAAVTGALGWLGGFGVSEHNIHKYEEALKNGKLLVIANSSELVANTARQILMRTDAEQVDSHAPTA